MLQITPLLSELRQGNLVGNLEALTKSAAEAVADIHSLQTEVIMVLLCQMQGRNTQHCLHALPQSCAYRPRHDWLCYTLARTTQPALRFMRHAHNDQMQRMLERINNLAVEPLAALNAELVWKQHGLLHVGCCLGVHRCLAPYGRAVGLHIHKHTAVGSLCLVQSSEEADTAKVAVAS